jgi:hypothetical protein
MVLNCATGRVISFDAEPDEGVIFFFADDDYTTLIAVTDYQTYSEPDGGNVATSEAFEDYQAELIKHGAPRVEKGLFAAFKFPVSQGEQEFYFLRDKFIGPVEQNTNPALRFFVGSVTINSYAYNQFLSTIKIKPGQSYYLITENDIREITEAEADAFVEKSYYTTSKPNVYFADISHQRGLIE